MPRLARNSRESPSMVPLCSRCRLDRPALLFQSGKRPGPKGTGCRDQEEGQSRSAGTRALVLSLGRGSNRVGWFNVLRDGHSQSGRC